ncbi:essential recombination function protein [Streptococcus pneumoniae]|nr:essential recombination function protein [Streptococcus pneumoniae]
MVETLRKKLLNIQRDLKAPKRQYNDFGKYSYRNAEDIMDCLLTLIPFVTVKKIILSI